MMFGKNLMCCQKTITARALTFAAQTPGTTVKRFGAVSSVVERLVYTENRGIFVFLGIKKEKRCFHRRNARAALNHVIPNPAQIGASSLEYQSRTA